MGFPEKQSCAQALIAQALEKRNGTISWQVVQEFMNVARHKFKSPLSLEDLAEYHDKILAPICSIHSSPEIYRQALAIQFETQYRFYDCLIIAAATQSGCKTLYSEDLQTDRKIGKLTIVNPFI